MDMRTGIRAPRRRGGFVLSAAISLALVPVLAARAQDPAPVGGNDARLSALEARVEAQAREIDALRTQVMNQQAAWDAAASGVDALALDGLRARGAAGQAAPAGAAQDATAARGDDPSDTRVGQAPESYDRPPEVAQIFDQPGVLTPKGKLILEPSLQTGYYANDRVALIGYTIIPAILIGLIDVRQVKTTSVTATLGARYGLGKRFEVEARVPYVYIKGDTVSREIFTGTAQDSVFTSDGRGIGDVELSARYQLANRGPEHPYYVLWLRYKTRTGKDVFDVVTDCVTRCVSNATGTGLPLELPTGSGFAALQPGVTWVYASDPVVFFGSLSYLHNFARDDLSRTVLSGAPEGFPQTTTEFIGEVDPGDILGFNIGMGLALNEKAAISIGYDHSIVGRARQNGHDMPGSVRVVLGTLLLGATYRLSDRTSLNFALGAGLTRDTPDVSLTLRLPVTF
ncbi:MULTISPECIES: acetate kinase [unclassified Luteimonas]|uniref:acetate kinase n=1 Tax=unclassified Luteimonas TaxID=2629088 RepID=UPI0018F072EB|nr:MULTISPECIES: acetate kinase [unclassified Luteimonas]MBJ6982824.1 acetate kinase [Luteimonas sp. MC1572]MBJ7574584.1 acetate kinase [Luteimonas sp. MC1828]QQO04054.1 acetate kinase [Luteimonas sp. MC1572]